MEVIDFDFDEPQPPLKFALRGRQQEWVDALETDLQTLSRLLVVAPGGVGKSTVFAALAARFHAKGKRSLVLSNRDALVRQTAKRIANETGIEVEIEMGSSTASPYTPIVVASIQTLGRVNRLTSFADEHFGLVVADEAHFSVSEQWQRVLKYFHYGAMSLEEKWTPPIDGTYEPKGAVVGFTATPDIGTRRNLGEFYQKKSVNYSYLDAVREGWLVQPVQRSIPVKIDLRKYKASHTPHGADFRVEDLSEALIPIIEELAEQIAKEAADRKTIAFLPSVQCAKMMQDALSRRGMNSVYVTGECEDGDEKTDLFRSWGKNSVLCNAQIFNFGIDFPDVDCVAWLRATLSKAFYLQGLYRGTRVLPGIIDGLQTAEERRAAIASSAKKDLLILDPLFVSDRIDLLDVYDLFTDKPEVKQRMKETGDLSAEGALKAERDFIASLEKEARKHARRQARTIDPLAHAVSLGDSALADWKPETKWDLDPMTPGQRDFLEKQGVATDKIKYKGLASKIINRLLARMKMHLATPRQLSLMAQLGLDEQTCAVLTAEQATAAIDAALKERRMSNEIPA